jgi:transposase
LCELIVVLIAKPYSYDFWRKFLEAYDTGKVSLAALAAQFGVGVDWENKISSARKRTGSMDRTPQSRHGSSSKVGIPSAGGAARSAAARTCRRVAGGHRHLGSAPQFCRVVKELGLRHNKSLPTPANGTGMKTVFGARASCRSARDHPGPSSVF